MISVIAGIPLANAAICRNTVIHRALFIRFGKMNKETGTLGLISHFIPMPIDPLSELTDPNRVALNNPRVKTFLDKISQSEGADYDTLVGGSRVRDLSRHPNKVGLTTKAGPSTAFGRYQITHSTHKSKLAKYADLDYSPENQDVRAVELLRQTGALKALEADDEATAIKRAGKEWASLPGSTLPGRKNYAAFREQDPLSELTKPQKIAPQVDPLTELTQSAPEPAQGRGAGMARGREGQQPSRGQARVSRVKPSTSSIPGLGSLRQFREQQSRPKVSLPDLKRADEQVVKRMTEGVTSTLPPTNVDPRVIKGEQPEDPLAYSRAQELATRVDPRRTEVTRAVGPRAFQSRRKTLTEYIPDAVKDLVPGLTSIDTPGGLKTEAIRSAIRSLNVIPGPQAEVIGSISQPRDILPEEKMLNPNAEADRATREFVGSQATSFLPYIAAGKAAALIENPVVRDAVTFGVVELGRQMSQQKEINPQALAESIVLGGAMGKIVGADPSLKRRLVGYLAPALAVGIAKGEKPEQLIETAVTNGLFAAYGGKKEAVEAEAPKAASIAPVIAESRAERVRRNVEGAQPPSTEIAGRAERSQRVRGTLENVPSIDLPRTALAETPRIERSVETSKLNRWQHRDFGLVTESSSQSGVGRGRVRVLAEDGTEHIIQRPKGTGAGNQIAVPVREKSDTQLSDEAAQAQENAPFKVVDRRGQGEPATTQSPSEQPNTLLSVPPESANIPQSQEVVSGPEPAASPASRVEFLENKLREMGAENATIANTPPERLAAINDTRGELERLRGEPSATQEPRLNNPPITSKPTSEVGSSATERPLGPTPAETTSPPSGEAGASPEPSTTSARKAQLASDAEALDLPELPPAERKAWQVSLDNAKAKGLNRKAEVLADEVMAKPRSLNDEETAGLVLRAQELKNELSTIRKEMVETADPAELAAKIAQSEALQRQFNQIRTAAKASGTEKGRTLAAQKLTINQDYDLTNLVYRATEAKGRQLTADEYSRYEKMASEIEGLQKQLVEAQEKQQTQTIQSTVTKIQREVRRANRKATKDVLNAEAATIKQNIAAEFARLKSQLGKQSTLSQQGLGLLDPDGVITKQIGKLARNRVEAGITDAAQLVDNVHGFLSEHLEGWTKRDIQDAIGRHGVLVKDRRSELTKEMARIRRELKQLSVQQDVGAGVLSARPEGPPRRLFSRNETRQKQLLKQEAEIERRLRERDFSEPEKTQPLPYTRDTYRIQRRVNELKEKFDREQYRARRGKTGMVLDTIAGTGNLPKTLLSMGDVSALLRQGGVGVYQHPILSGKAAADMIRSFTQHGFANVENAIKSHPDFETLKRAGVEFTGIDKNSPRLSAREEGYLGSDVIDTLAKGRVNPLRLVKGVKDFSERTFVSFLDSQRMRIGAHQLEALRGMKLTPEQLRDAIKSQAKYINIITGRGSLGQRGNQAAPLLNVAMFSPRLIASRVQLLNKMFNPGSWVNTPKGARKLQMVDNAKFLFGVASTLALAKAAGANVNLDPDDSEFLKIKAGNTRYDMLAGLQQPMRFMLRMGGYGGGKLGGAVRGGETYSGDTKSDIALDFARSKSAPLAGYAWDWLEGKNRLSGKRFEAGKDLAKTAIPLPAQDFAEAIKQDGKLRGIVEAFPSLLGVGVQTYPTAPEKPTTRAEKLTRKLIRDRMPDEGRTQEEIDRDQNLAEIRAQARRGVDVSKTLDALQKQGTITEKQSKSIISSRSQTRLQQGFRKLGLKEALTVYSTATADERKALSGILGEKAQGVELLPLDDQAEARKKLSDFGFKPGLQIPKRPERPERPKRPDPRAWIYQTSAP